jgi:hypothetical protein
MESLRVLVQGRIGAFQNTMFVRVNLQPAMVAGPESLWAGYRPEQRILLTKNSVTA